MGPGLRRDDGLKVNAEKKISALRQKSRRKKTAPEGAVLVQSNPDYSASS
jgi:hypothetical protein